MRFGISLCSALLLSLCAQQASAATDVFGGNIINQTWTAAGSPYIVYGDITVPSGSFLHMQPGTEVRVKSSDQQASGVSTTLIELTVQGELVIAGSQAQPVHIHADVGSNNQTWYGVILENSTVNADLSWLTMEHASQGLRSEALGSTLSIQTSNFANCYSYGVRLYDGASLFDRVLLHDIVNYGVRVEGGSVTMTNVITRNTSYGFTVVGGNANIYHSLAYGNSSRGIYVIGGTADVVNSIVSNNPGYGCYRSSGTLSVSDSNVWGNTTNFSGSISQSGNLSANPQFASPPQDLSLTATSVCIDAASSSMLLHDFDNVVRPLDGDGINAAEPDIGPYEYVANPICGDAIQTGGEVCDDGAANGSYGFCNANCSGPGEYCGDGTTNGPEQCDDGNTVSGDGCDSMCLDENMGSGGMGSGGMGTGGSGATGGMGSGGMGTGGSGATGGMGSGGMGMGGNGSGAGMSGPCVPGEQVACACPGASDGVQVCNETGDGFGSCSCSSGSGNGADSTGDEGGCTVRAPGDDHERRGGWALALMALAWVARRRRS